MCVSQHYVQISRQILDQCSKLIPARQPVHHMAKTCHAKLIKGQQRKIKGAICNVPVKCNETCNILPRPPDRSGIILLKLMETSI